MGQVLRGAKIAHDFFNKQINQMVKNTAVIFNLSSKNTLCLLVTNLLLFTNEMAD